MIMDVHQKVRIDLQYLPSLEYFTVFHKYQNIEIESHEYFVKQSYRNRAHILSANGQSTLSIPMIGGNSKILAKDIMIDNGQRWLNTHWRGIISAYGKAPFFEYYADYFHDIFFREHTRLFDLNHELLTLCLKLIGHDNVVALSEKYDIETPHETLDLRSSIHPKKDFTENKFYQPYSYIQLFGKDFVPNLSIIDALFCEGPNTSNIIHQSSVSV